MQITISINENQVLSVNNNAIFTPTQQREYDAGYRDRMAGYYDKWYRRYGSKDGKYYDLGVHSALQDGVKTENFTLIECN